MYKPNVDWKMKYIKYKTKYINLKNKNDISMTNDIMDLTNDYFNMLKQLYPNCIKKLNESNDKTHVYGEMEYEGIEKLYNEIKEINPQISYFIDIGSGRGKIPCWFAGLVNIIKSLGIEIVEQRCRDAKQLKSNLEVKFPEQTNKIQLLCGDVSKYNLSTLTSNSSNILVWISNLCFGEELTKKVFSQIIEQLGIGSIITCSKKPFIQTNEMDTDTDLNIKNNKLQFIKTIEIQMSWWDKLSEVHVYRII